MICGAFLYAFSAQAGAKPWQKSRDQGRCDHGDTRVQAEGDGRAIDLGEFANLQTAERARANGEDEAAHGAVSHVIAGSGQDDGTLHHAEKGLAQTGEHEEKNGERIGQGKRRSEQGQRAHPRGAKGKGEQREGLEDRPDRKDPPATEARAQYVDGVKPKKRPDAIARAQHAVFIRAFAENVVRENRQDSLVGEGQKIHDRRDEQRAHNGLAGTHVL